MINILNFESEIDKIILKRGRDYYENDHVEEITEIKKNYYQIEVLGSDMYMVTVDLDSNNNIIQSFCDCPYDLGEFCKHEVAAYYALRSYKDIEKKKTTSKIVEVRKSSSLKDTLSGLSKDKLIDIISNIAEDYPMIAKQLSYRYSSAKNELQASKEIINECIKRYKKRGFIAWNDVENALQGAELILTKANEKLDTNELETSISMSLLIISSVVNMLDYCDDSLGHPSEIISECLVLINRAVYLSEIRTSASVQSNVFDMLLKEASDKKYYGFIEWSIELLRNASFLIKNLKMRFSLEKQLNLLIERDRNSSWSSNYLMEQVKILQLEIITRLDGTQKAGEYILENVHISAFREMALDKLLENKNYGEIIRLCEEGIAKDKNYRGLVKQWEKYQLDAYIGLEDRQKQEELMLKFLYDGEYEYYKKIKAMYVQDNWAIKLDRILETFEKMRYIPEAYVEILKLEGLTDKILIYCQHHISSITHLYTYLVDAKPSEANTLYINYIDKQALSANNRSQYRQVCKLIRQYIKVSDKQKGSELITNLQKAYVRRPAFIDELNKI